MLLNLLLCQYSVFYQKYRQHSFLLLIDVLSENDDDHFKFLNSSFRLLFNFFLSLEKQLDHEGLDKSASQPVEVVLVVATQHMLQQGKDRLILVLFHRLKKPSTSYSPIVVFDEGMQVLFVSLELFRSLKFIEVA